MRKILINIERTYYSKEGRDFSEIENQNIDKGMQIGLINRDAFIDVTKLSSDNKQFRQNTKIFPLTESGYNFVHKNKYIRFRDSIPVRILTDLLLVISFLLALYVSMNQITTEKVKDEKVEVIVDRK